MMKDYVINFFDCNAECDAAAKWWVNWLRKPEAKHNHNAEWLDLFEAELAFMFRMKIGSAGTWDKDNPQLGAYYRAISYDWQPCKELADIARMFSIDIGIGSNFPFKTVMWINPGDVHVRYTETGGLEVVYSIPAKR